MVARRTYPGPGYIGVYARFRPVAIASQPSRDVDQILGDDANALQGPHVVLALPQRRHGTRLGDAFGHARKHAGGVVPDEFGHVPRLDGPERRRVRPIDRVGLVLDQQRRAGEQHAGGKILRREERGGIGAHLGAVPESRRRPAVARPEVETQRLPPGRCGELAGKSRGRQLEERKVAEAG